MVGGSLGGQGLGPDEYMVLKEPATARRFKYYRESCLTRATTRLGVAWQLRSFPLRIRTQFNLQNKARMESSGQKEKDDKAEKQLYLAYVARIYTYSIPTYTIDPYVS